MGLKHVDVIKLNGVRSDSSRALMAEWNKEEKAPNRVRAAVYAAFVAFTLLAVSAVVSVVFLKLETDSVDEAAQQRAESAADTYQSILQATTDAMLSDLLALQRLYESACARSSRVDELFVIEPAEFAAFAAISEAENEHLRAVTVVVATHDDVERRHVETVASQRASLGTVRPTFGLLPPYYNATGALPYTNDTHLIVALTQGGTNTSIMLDIKTMFDNPLYALITDDFHAAAASGKPQATSWLASGTTTLFTVPVYTCGSTSQHAAGDPFPHLSNHVSGWLLATYATAEHVKDKLYAFANLQAAYHIDVHEKAAPGSTAEPVKVFVGGPELGGEDFQAFTATRLVRVGSRVWEITVTSVPGTKQRETEKQLVTLVVAMPLLLGAVAAIAVLVAACVQAKRSAIAAQVTMDAMDATHQYVVAYVCHEMRNPLHACMAYMELAMLTAETDLTVPRSEEERLRDAQLVKRDLESATAAAHQMTSVLDDVMDMRRLNKGELTVTPAHVNDVSDVMRDLSNQYRYLLDPAVHLTLDLASCSGVIDRSRLRQVLGNGLHKATRATNKGNITLISEEFRLRADMCACMNSSQAKKRGASTPHGRSGTPHGRSGTPHGRGTPKGQGSDRMAFNFHRDLESQDDGGEPPSESSHDRGQAELPMVPWLLCQIISTPDSSLSSSVVKFNEELQARARVPAEVLELVNRPLVTSGEPISRPMSPLSSPMHSTPKRTMSGTGSATPMSASASANALSAWSGAALSPTSWAASSDAKKQGKDVVRHLRNKAETGLTLPLCAKVVRAMDGYMGICADSQRQVRFWVAVPLRTHVEADAVTDIAPVPVKKKPRAARGSIPSSYTMTRPPVTAVESRKWVVHRDASLPGDPSLRAREQPRVETSAMSPLTGPSSSTVSLSGVGAPLEPSSSSSQPSSREASADTLGLAQAAAAELHPLAGSTELPSVMEAADDSTPTAAAGRRRETRLSPLEGEESKVVSPTVVVPAPRPEHHHTALVVAVVDDEPVVRKTTSRFLMKLKHRPVMFEDGLPLVDMLLSESNSIGIEVVLLDIIMRNSNGVEVCRALRSAGITLPIVAMTGNVDPASLQLYDSVGFTTVMGKPFNKTKLAATIEACTQDDR